MECKFCKEEISSDCRKCPACGSDLERGKKLGLGCLLWAMITLAILAVSAALQ